MTIPDDKTISLLGAACFGAIIGWFVYYINRFRKEDVQFQDLVTLIGIIGGASITALFGSAGSPGNAEAGARFGAYGIGLAVGFFGYFIALIVFVRLSEGIFTSTWFLDGRRKQIKTDETIDGSRVTVSPMSAMDEQVAPVEVAAQRLEAVLGRVERAATAFAAPAPHPNLHPNATRILEKCAALWEGNKDDCNHFALAVATALGVTGLQPPADAIVDTIRTAAGWRQLADGVEAKAAAEAGELVIGGLRGDEQSPAVAHGHVVVVVAGALAHAKYPTAYWGSISGNFAKNQTVNYAWKAADRDQVHYAARQI